MPCPCGRNTLMLLRILNNLLILTPSLSIMKKPLWKTQVVM
nr:MAG TPA: hypothetical protein [Crassvirales sp.]